MNTKELDALVNQTFAEINRLLVVKGGEYANAEDRLANFKRGAGLTGCTPLQVLFIYMSKHYDAVASFVQTSAKGKARPSSEPIEGRLDDLINYCLLAKGLIRESKLEEQSKAQEAAEHLADKLENPEKYISSPRQSGKSQISGSPYTDVEAARAIGNAGKPLNLGPEHC